MKLRLNYNSYYYKYCWLVEGAGLVSPWSIVLLNNWRSLYHTAFHPFWCSCFLLVVQKQAKTSVCFSTEIINFEFWRPYSHEFLIASRINFVPLPLIFLFMYLSGQDQACQERYVHFSHGAWRHASEKVYVFRWSQNITRAILDWDVEFLKFYKINLIASFLSSWSSSNKQYIDPLIQIFDWEFHKIKGIERPRLV